MESKVISHKPLPENAFQFLINMAGLTGQEKVLLIGDFDGIDQITWPKNNPISLISHFDPKSKKVKHLGDSVVRLFVVLPKDYDFVISVPPLKPEDEVELIVRLHELIHPTGAIIALCSNRFMEGSHQAYRVLKNYLDTEVKSELGGFPLHIQNQLYQNQFMQTCILFICLVDRDKAEKHNKEEIQSSKDEFGLKVDKLPDFESVYVFHYEKQMIGKAETKTQLVQYEEKGYSKLNQEELIRIFTLFLEDAASKNLKSVKKFLGLLDELESNSTS